MTTTIDTSLLQTKVSPPKLAAYVIERPRLLARMTASLDLPLTIVMAPTGYGKTTLVTGWLETAGVTSAWVSLDEFDNDVVTVVGYILTALSKTAPEAPLSTWDLLHSPQEVPLNVLADSLIRDMARIPGPLVLAVDDYHTMELDAIHELMGRLIRNVPAHVHLVILSRHALPIALTRLRAQGYVNAIGVPELAFTFDEAGMMLNHITSKPLDPQVIDLLRRRTEGWAAGLQLAGLSARSKSSADLSEQLAHLGNGLIVDYLLEEVAALIPTDMQDFLLRTSILDELNADLCNAILLDTGEGGAALPEAHQMLERVVQANLFVVSLDDEHRWFRYHLLMRDLLRRMLAERVPEEEVQRLHRRACTWFAATGQIAPAIKHALAAGDDLTAAQLVEANVETVFRNNDWRLGARWLGMLPASVADRPALLVARATLERIQFRMNNVVTLAQQAETALDEAGASIPAHEQRRLLGHIDSLRGAAAYWAGDPETGLRLATSALDRFGNEMSFSAMVSLQQTAFCLAALGESEAAILKLQKQLDNVSPDDGDIVARLLLGMCSVYLSDGHLMALGPTLKSFASAAESANQPLTIGWSQFGLGYLAYEWNDLDGAERHYRNVVDARYGLSTKNVADSYVGLSMTLHAAGRDEEVAQALEDFREYITEGNHTRYMTIAMSLEMRLSAMRTGVASYAGAPTFEAPLNLSFQECPALTAAQLLLMSGSAEELTRAGTILKDASLYAARLHDKRRLIAIYALTAMRWQALGNMDKAVSNMRASLNISSRGRYIRTYVDLGDTLIPCLEAVREQDLHVDYINDLLQALQRDDAPHAIIDLTNREMDVLERMAQRKSNKEIASDLFLSPQTVKTHAQNMYRKLGATNRREAVEIGRHRGLIV